MTEQCRYCGSNAVIPVVDEKKAQTNSSGNKYRQYCRSCDRSLPMCSEADFRTHPNPHVHLTDECEYGTRLIPLREYEGPLEFDATAQEQRSCTETPGEQVNSSRPLRTDGSSAPVEELESWLDRMIDDELGRMESQFRDLGILERQLISTEQAVFGVKMYLWGKLYGMITGTGTAVFDELEDYEVEDLDQWGDSVAHVADSSRERRRHTEPFREVVDENGASDRGGSRKRISQRIADEFHEAANVACLSSTVHRFILSTL